jgi:hypothetical protein
LFTTAVQTRLKTALEVAPQGIFTNRCFFSKTKSFAARGQTAVVLLEANNQIYRLY